MPRRPWTDPNKHIAPMVSYLTVTIKGSEPILVQVKATPVPGMPCEYKHEGRRTNPRGIMQSADRSRALPA
jgi:hypothetical protein